MNKMKTDNQRKLGEKRRIESLKKIEEFCNGKILDVGCGFGITSNYFFENGFSIEGIDINRNCIKNAIKRFKGIKFYVKDIKKIKGRYDTILLIGVLEEILPNPLEVLKNLKNNLNKGGKIIIEVRNTNSLKRRIKTLFGLQPVDPFSPRLWCFTKKRLKKIIQNADYDLIKISSNKFESFRNINLPTPDCLSEEIWTVIKPRKTK